MKKIFLLGLLVGLVNLFLGMAVSYLFMLFPSVATDYNNPNMMRSWQDPVMLLFFLHPFIQGIIFAWVWDKSRNLLNGSVWSRGSKFGFSIWLIASVPGMLISYSSFPFSLLTIISWLASGLVNGIAAGLIFAKLNMGRD